MNEQVDITIIVPCRERPNFLAVALDGLARYSYHRLHVIIVNSTPIIWDDDLAPPDYYIDLETGERLGKYLRISQFCDMNPDLVKKLDISLIDVTENVGLFKAKYEQGLVYDGKTEYMDGVDIAYKDNIGLGLVDTPWVVPNWDDDFYPYQDWDKHLIDLVDRFPEKTIFIPRHVQPFSQEQINYFATNNQYDFYGQAWFIETHRTLDGGWVTEEEWANYCETHARDEVVVESCGNRQKCHYLPMLYRTDELMKTIGPYSYQGGGYEAEMDDRCGDFGFQKASSHRSFILHKGYVARVKGDI